MYGFFSLLELRATPFDRSTASVMTMGTGNNVGQMGTVWTQVGTMLAEVGTMTIYKILAFRYNSPILDESSF